MKFVSFIASTILIVLISQHSINGLPVNITIVKESCPNGYEMIEGQCTATDSVASSTVSETSSSQPEEMIAYDKPPVTELNIPKNSGGCPEGMVHGEHGICQEIQPSDTTEITVQSTTDHNENVGGVENIKGCPTGTEADEQGACQEIKRVNSTKIVINPKSLLKQDGSCPDNYKMIEGRCLYIKTKVNSTLQSSGSIADETVSAFARPKSGNADSSKIELVPVLYDNSCPEGTQYSEYGLCEKRTRLPNSGLRMKADGSCPDGFKLIGGKCSYKNTKIQDQAGYTTTTIKMPTNSTLAEHEINNDEVPKSTTTTTTVEESDHKLQLETTFSPN